MKLPGDTTDELLVGRRAIAELLSALLGCPVREVEVSRLVVRQRHPLPMVGYVGTNKAWRSSLVTWVEEEQQRRVRPPRKRSNNGNSSRRDNHAEGSKHGQHDKGSKGSKHDSPASRPR